MVNGKNIFNVHLPNILGLIEGWCTVCEQLWVDLNPWPFAQKVTTLTTVPRRPHTNNKNKNNNKNNMYTKHLTLSPARAGLDSNTAVNGT